MATVEKRRSSRKSGHRKRTDGGYSDTETDREVSSLTDRAFRSLCIGDEAVYNDSDLCASPSTQKDSDRQELKRTAHESFSFRVQQYGQDWMYRGTYDAEVHKDQQWGVYGERGPQERSSTFQQASVAAPQQENAIRELSLVSNGTSEVSSQQRRSNSRVSSLIRAFNSEGQGDETMYNDEASWDKTALMSIERELSEFSSYPQNINAGYFPSTGIISSQNANYYSAEVAAISQMNSASSFLRSSHSMSAQVNSNFFIHSEFSPFKVWRDQNRFPFNGGQVSGFMPRSEFQKWYETPMYKELSLQPQQHPSLFSQGYHSNTFAPAIPMTPQRSTSASTMLHRASALEKRCESELAGQYRKRAQSVGGNRLPPQRPSTASPSSEMSRQVRDTISSVKSLQQKIKMMTEQNLETQSQGGFYNHYLNSYDPVAPNIVNSNPYTAPYQIQNSSIYPQQQLHQHHSVSPQPVEHAPVRAESRGATPDVKMSNYKSRAASLLYNLKDNRKRVKATYSPGAFKGQNTQEKYTQEPKDFIIDVPEFSTNELLNSTDANRHVEDNDLPTAEEIIKQLRRENLNSDDTEEQEEMDIHDSIMERLESEEPQLIVEHANTDELKEEPIKCELAASSEEARIEHVKSEPSRKERVVTEQAAETQVGVEHVERMRVEDRSEAKQAVTELRIESQGNTQPEENTDTDIVEANDIFTPVIDVQKSQKKKK
ncbi:hypothetical protein WMY93_007204 [Mugilogobius chulae]|uniref:Uncharacterized protein n=1 Tax=Mugilogobius chulae TaxID=88201 RepID=A0AAW0PQE4_9GOBI